MPTPTTPGTPPANTPSVSTSPPAGGSRRRWSFVPHHLGRARTSTLVLGLLFIAFLALYLSVRPEVTTAGTTAPADISTPAPQAPVPVPAEPTEPAETTAPAEPTEPTPTPTTQPTGPTTTESPAGGTTDGPPAETTGPDTTPAEPTTAPAPSTTPPADTPPP